MDFVNETGFYPLRRVAMTKFMFNLFVVVMLTGFVSCLTGVAQEAASAATKQKCENCADGECKCADAEKDVATSAKAKKSDSLKSTHVQTSTFSPQINGKNARLSTFRIRPDGNIVACVSPMSQRRGKKKKDEDAPKVHAGYIQVYSPDLELVNEFGLPFAPTAIDLDQSGNMFVGGAGKVAKLSKEGEIVAECESPNMVGVDMEELKREMKEEMIEQQEQMKKSFERQIKQMEERIAKLKEKSEEEELSKAEAKKLKRYETQLDSISSFFDQQQTEITDEQIEARLQFSSRITAIAVTQDDLYVATTARVGYSYEVYRFNHNFENPERVLEGLRGCCGQMDIHAMGENLAVAENTKYNVAVYDRDGKEVNRFGERLSGDNQGFGSCCNPMNVLCCENGDYLTAESSVGKIKRFNEAGELVGYIGEAKIGGGCKHVAFGHDAERNRYYVQHEDSNKICILNARPIQDAKAEKKSDADASQD